LAFEVMQWLLVALLVSVCGLLLAAVGVARHIWRQRQRRSAGEPQETAEPPVEKQLESKP
jgi:hypothetical protein